MTPAARTQAAIELLDAIAAAARDAGPAADTLVSRYFATRRYAGSKDRRAVRELVYAAIRALGEPPASGRAALLALAQDDAALAATFDGSGHGPAPIEDGEPVASRGIVAGWLAAALETSGVASAEWPALIERAPLDVRLNALDPPPVEPGETILGLDFGRRLPAGTDLTSFAGQLEPQDAGSQFVTLAAEARPGQQVVDLCAGAGGKTLALAAAMANEGAILACDTDRGRLSRLAPRAKLAGVNIAEPRLLDPQREAAQLSDWQGSADLVLVDAPCSGTGTWRRNPEARWRLTPARLDRLASTQRHVLSVAAPLVRPGGALVFIVCSLLDMEGADQTAAFLAANPTWRAEPIDLPVGRPHGSGRRLTPAHDDTDGFYVARFRAPC